MISRIWHGYTTPANADAYEDVLLNEVIVGIKGREIPGFNEIQVFRRDLGDEVEFITVMWFDSLDAVPAFAGDDWETAVVPEEARRVLARFDARSQHYDVRERVTARDQGSR